MNSAISRHLCACARHARLLHRCFFLVYSLGLAAIFSLTSPIFADGLEPISPDQPTVPASLSGLVFYDQNHNSIPDTTEWAIPGANILLFNANDLNTPVATTTSNSNGFYIFGSLVAGDYIVQNATANGNWLPLPGTINHAPVGTADSANAEINNITLQGADFGENYNFAGNQYPIQMISKRMLLASTPHSSDKIIPVPEPGVALMLIVAAVACGVWTAGRRYFKK